jgi:hypothetical protein
LIVWDVTPDTNLLKEKMVATTTAMVHHNHLADGVVSTASAAQRAASFDDMTMGTSDGEEPDLFVLLHSP